MNSDTLIFFEEIYLDKIRRNNINDVHKPNVMFYYKLRDEPTQKDLIQLIEQLPKKYQEAVYLAEVEDASPHAIAKKLNLNFYTAKTRVQRGRTHLMELLKISNPSLIYFMGIRFPENRSKGKTP